MATSNTATTTLRPSKAPNLPIAPVEYSQQFMDQFSNVLRLYFNQIDNFGAGVGGSNGGSYIQFPFIAASDSATQYATANNTATIILWNSLDAGNGFTLNANSTATAQVSGTYKITYSLQLANDFNGAEDVVVWLKSNGTQINNSTTIFTIPARKSAGIPAFICGYSECVFPLNAGDNVGLYWGTPRAAAANGVTGTYIYALGAQTTPMAYPAVPSVIGSITFVSALTT